MSLSRTKTKEYILNKLADHFKETGTTTSVTVDEIVDETNQREKRVQSLINELIDEDALEIREEEGHYYLSGFIYMQLVDQLERMGELPDILKDSIKKRDKNDR